MDPGAEGCKHYVLMFPGGGRGFHQRRVRPSCAMWARIRWRASWSGGEPRGFLPRKLDSIPQGGHDESTGRFWRHEEKSTAKIASSPAASESGDAVA
jgi:hypothetical protein